MAFDFKKEYKELYMPKTEPEIIDVPQMNFIAVRGKATRMKRMVLINRPSIFFMQLHTQLR